MTDTAKPINEYLAAAKAYQDRYEAQAGQPVSLDEIQVALEEVLNVTHSTDLLLRSWDVETIALLLDSYQFGKLRPIEVDSVYLADSIIPAGTLVDIQEETIRSLSQKWVINRNDADPFPSNPHAHCVGTGLKLHLGTGILFRKKEFAGTIRWKDLLALRQQIRYRPLPELDKAARQQ